MSSQKKQHEKQLGIESLEKRLNQSVVPMVVPAMSMHYAMPVQRVAASKAGLIKVAAPAKASSHAAPVKAVVTKPAVTKVVAKPVAKPVVSKPATTTKTAPVVQTSVTPPATNSVTTAPVVVAPTISAPVTPATPTAPVTTPAQIPAPMPAVSTPATSTSTPATTTTTTTTAPATPQNTNVVAPANASVTTSVAPSVTPSVTPSTNTTTTTNTTTAPDPLAPILAKLYGDGVHDDSGTIQQLVDTAYANGYTNITLPAGTFLLDRQIDLYGTNVTFSGQGDSTVLDVNNNFNGVPGGTNGVALSIRATLDATPLMIAQPVTGNTIVFRGGAPVTAGQKLFLTNGLGSTMLLEAQLHGSGTAPGEFNELGPDEYVQVASVAQDASGNTVVTLTQNVIGAGQYSNVAGAGVNSIDYLHALAVNLPTENITAQNLAIKFNNMKADAAIIAKFADGLTLNGIHILNTPTHGGEGGIGIVGSTHVLVENVVASAGIGLNSTRGATVINNTVAGIGLEEASTDNLITQNTLTGTTQCDFRINDMACARNTFSYNTMHGGVWNTGAIAIAEGTDTTIANNVIHGGSAMIWLGNTTGSKILNNIADGFANYSPLNAIVSSGNSWGS